MIDTVRSGGTLCIDTVQVQLDEIKVSLNMLKRLVESKGINEVTASAIHTLSSRPHRQPIMLP